MQWNSPPTIISTIPNKIVLAVGERYKQNNIRVVDPDGDKVFIGGHIRFEGVNRDFYILYDENENCILTLEEFGIDFLYSEGEATIIVYDEHNLST